MIKPGTVAKLTINGPLMTAIRYDLISALWEWNFFDGDILHKVYLYLIKLLSKVKTYSL